MKQQSRRMAVCGVIAALGVVIMLLGNVLGLGMYLAPMIVGACLIPIGKTWGVKYHILLWIAIGILSVIFVSNPEQNLIFLGLLGWYPILRPTLQRLPVALRILGKILLFNIIIIALEALVMLVLVPESMEAPFVVVLLLLGNATFLLYDYVLPRIEILISKYANRLLQ